MTVAEMILRYIRVFVDWPLLTLVLVLTTLKRLHEPLAALLNRIGSLEGYGIRVSTIEPAQQRRELDAGLEPKTQDALLEFVKKNPEEVAKYHLRLANGYQFERAFNLIYGSQLELLEYLQVKADAGEKYVNLLQFFQTFLKRGGPQATQFADYLSFLRNFHFIEYVDREGDQHVRITPFGVDFLSYLHAQYPTGFPFKPW
jgi:hypothetical protein